MAGENQVGIDIVARLDQFRADMAKIPDIGGKEAKALAAQLSKEIKSAERAARSAARASRESGAAADKSGGSFVRAGEAAEAAGSGFSKAAQALGVLPGPAGAAIQSLADLADGGELALQVGEAIGLSFGGVVAVSGALAVGLAGVTAGYYAVEGGIARAKAEQEAYAGITASLVPTLRALQDAQLDLAVATGQMTEAEAAQSSAALGAQRAVLDFAAAQGEQRKELRASVAEGEKWLSIVNAILPAQVNLGGAAADAVFGWSDSIDSATRQLAALDAAVVTESANQKRLKDVVQDVTQGTTQGAQADKTAEAAKKAIASAATRAADALRAQAEALREARAAADADGAAHLEAAGAIDALRAAADASADARLEGEAKVRDALAETLAALRDQYQATLELTAAGVAGDAQRTAATQAYLAAKTEAEVTAELEIDAVRAATAKAEGERQAKLLADRQAASAEYLASMSGLYGAITDIAAASGEAINEDDKEAKLAAFYIAQAAAAAQAGINTFLGISTALATGNYVGAVAAGVAGLAAEINILSTPPPSFHRGYAPDEFPATLKQGEGVLSTAGVAAAGGPDAVRAMNSGLAGGGGSVVVVRMKHKVFDAQAEENVRAGGAIARTVARAAGRRGRRHKG